MTFSPQFNIFKDLRINSPINEFKAFPKSIKTINPFKVRVIYSFMMSNITVEFSLVNLPLITLFYPYKLILEKINLILSYSDKCE